MSTRHPDDQVVADYFNALLAKMAERDPKVFQALGAFLTSSSPSSHERDEAASR